MKISFLVVVTIVTAVFDVKAANRITNLMRKYNVIGDLVQEGANQELEVGWDDIYITPPTEMDPSEVQNKPDAVEWNADSKDYYTLIYIAADYPNSGRKESQLLKWLVVNIPGNDWEKGETLVEYLPDPEGRDTSPNRFVFFVYNQKGYRKFEEKHIAKDSLEPRKTFSTYNFAKKYEMASAPEACTFYYSRA